MPDIKFQLMRGNTPPEHVDFRKSTGGFIGSPDDEHTTFLEITNAASEIVDFVLREGPTVNKLFAELAKAEPDMVGGILTAIGVDGTGPIVPVVRVYDE
jgi:hypothetical protein